MMSTDQAPPGGVWPGRREKEGAAVTFLEDQMKWEVRGVTSQSYKSTLSKQSTCICLSGHTTQHGKQQSADFTQKYFFGSQILLGLMSNKGGRWECWWSSREDQFKWWHEIGGKWFGCFNLPSLGTNKIANCKKISNVSCDKNKAACNSDVQSTFITERTCLYCFHLSRSAV